MGFFTLVVFKLMIVNVYADPGYFLNNPGTVQVPYAHNTDYKIWESISAVYHTTKNCTEMSCNFNFGAPECREVIRSCPTTVQYDRCDFSHNPNDIFFIKDLTIWMRPCTVTECQNTCPGSSCLPPGTTVTVGVRCWSSVDETAGNVTTNVNVTSVQGLPFSSCPLLTVPNGILSSADTRHCNFVRISCIKGYHVIGESALTCCNATWNTAPPTCQKACYSFTVDNAVVIAKDTDDGTTATVICHNGYSLTESPTLSCTDGAWSKQPPKCFADCKPLSIPKGNVSATETAHGTQTEVKCDAGYTLSGTSTLTCDNGSWANVFPTCQKEDERSTVGQNNTLVICNCTANNTITPEQPCDPDSGKCRCLPNWEGKRCNDDVDECQQELHNCDVTKEICRNLPGGFECDVIQAVVLKQTNDTQEYVIPVALGLVTFFLCFVTLASLLFVRRLKRNRLKSVDGGELSYVDLDILKDKDLRTRNYSHASEDSGYFEKCWDNPVHIHTEEVETNPGLNPAQEPAARHRPCPVGPGPCPVGPGPCPVKPGQEVDWDSEDLTYL